MEGIDSTDELTEGNEIKWSAIGKKKIFVAGATGSTGRRIVEQLLAKGFRVKAGVRDLDKAKTSLPQDNPALEIVSFFKYFKCRPHARNSVGSLLFLGLLNVWGFG